MTLSEIQAEISKLEKQKRDVQADIYRLPIANRHKAVQDRENELYEELDHLQVQIKACYATEQYQEWLNGN